MVFWKKKPKPTSERPEARPGPAAASGDTGGDDASVFLTGDAYEDKRRTDSLFEEYASIAERVVKLRGKEDLDDLLTYIVDASVKRTGSERGFLILDGGDGELRIRIARDGDGAPLQNDLRYSTSVVKRVLETGTPLKQITSSVAGDLGRSVIDLKLRSLMCVPIEAGEGGAAIRGVLYVDSKVGTRDFGAPDLAYFARLTTQIVSALKTMAAHLDAVERARLEASLDYASVVQKDLMPTVPTDFTGFDVFGWYRAAERTSGDFYDFFKTRDGRFGVVVGDVTGHGPASALITSQVQASLRSMVRIVPDLGEAVTLVNQDLASRIQVGNLVTLCVALMSPSGEIQLLNAGHTPPRIFERSSGKLRAIAAHGPALGMMEDYCFDSCERFQMATGDVLVAFTDGISEARKIEVPDELYGEEGLASLFAQEVLHAANARQLTERLVQGVLEFCQENCEDDMTMVTVRRAD